MSSTSYFNTDRCCMDCLKVERQHPQYAQARKIEEAEIRAGNLNFPGVGLPKDYADFVRSHSETH